MEKKNKTSKNKKQPLKLVRVYMYKKTKTKNKNTKIKKPKNAQSIPLKSKREVTAIRQREYDTRTDWDTNNIHHR